MVGVPIYYIFYHFGHTATCNIWDLGEIQIKMIVLVPDAVDNPDEDLMSNHPIQATADLPDVGLRICHF